jgi:hypothetical protein
MTRHKEAVGYVGNGDPICIIPAWAAAWAELGASAHQLVPRHFGNHGTK